VSVHFAVQFPIRFSRTPSSRRGQRRPNPPGLENGMSGQRLLSIGHRVSSPRACVNHARALPPTRGRGAPRARSRIPRSRSIPPRFSSPAGLSRAEQFERNRDIIHSGCRAQHRAVGLLACAVHDHAQALGVSFESEACTPPSPIPSCFAGGKGNTSPIALLLVGSGADVTAPSTFASLRPVPFGLPAEGPACTEWSMIIL
jgi:hypothetical protein